jgi:hypothetical protein
MQRNSLRLPSMVSHVQPLVQVDRNLTVINVTAKRDFAVGRGSWPR